MAAAPADAEPAMLTIGDASKALGVSVDTLRRWDRDGRIAFERRNGRRLIAAVEVARMLRERTHSGQSSARNRMEGVVLAVKVDGVMAQVDMACGPFRVVSLMSREACEELDLKPGSRTEAIIKATNVIVETPGPKTTKAPR
ncbi:MAG TPA: TOBE domain-containing protein [Baekduia sp.]